MEQETDNADEELSSEKREFPRFTHRSKVRLTDTEGQVSEVVTRDLSHGGIFLILHSVQLPAMGSFVRVQALDIEDALEQVAEVVRVDPGEGIAVKFAE